MFETAKTVILAVARLLGIIENEQERQKREEAKQQGRTEQQLADHENTLKDKDDQLEKAVNARPGDARRSLRDGTF